MIIYNRGEQTTAPKEKERGRGKVKERERKERSALNSDNHRNGWIKQHSLMIGIHILAKLNKQPCIAAVVLT